MGKTWKDTRKRNVDTIVYNKKHTIKNHYFETEPEECDENYKTFQRLHSKMR